MRILARTDELSEAEWLGLRRRGIGGADAGRLDFATWAEKTGKTSGARTNEAMEWGHVLERPVAEQFAKRSGNAVVRWPVMLQGERPFQLANVDFWIVEPSWDFPEGVVTDLAAGSNLSLASIVAVLEVKTTGIASPGTAHLWDDDGVPPVYEAQGLHYSCVTSIPAVVYACLAGGRGLLVRERHYSDPQREAQTALEAAFWDLVTSDTPPEPDGSERTSEALHEMFPLSESREVEADDFTFDTFLAWQAAKARLVEVEELVKRHRASLELSLGSADTLTYQGDTLLTYKSQRTGSRFDLESFRADHPEVHQKYLKDRPGARVMLDKRR